MRYVLARYRKHMRDLTYRIYVTDCLRIITENTAKCSAGGGTYMTGRYIDSMKRTKVDNRTGTEIAADIIKKAGLVVIE